MMLRFFARVNTIVITRARGGYGYWYWPPGFVFLQTWGWGSAAEALTRATLDEAMSTPPGKAGYHVLTVSGIHVRRKRTVSRHPAVDFWFNSKSMDAIPGLLTRVSGSINMGARPR